MVTILMRMRVRIIERVKRVRRGVENALLMLIRMEIRRCLMRLMVELHAFSQHRNNTLTFDLQQFARLLSRLDSTNPNGSQHSIGSHKEIPHLATHFVNQRRTHAPSSPTPHQRHSPCTTSSTSPILAHPFHITYMARDEEINREKTFSDKSMYDCRIKTIGTSKDMRRGKELHNAPHGID